ncbi:MAG: TonB-dependent receptor [Bacteroidia bacterium]|nr:TonB-dependent receptor [Bacteroidia bacterium]
MNMHPMQKMLAVLMLAGWGIQAAAQTGGQVVRGSVTDQSSGRPLAGAAVQIERGAFAVRAETDTAGRFRLEGVPAGRLLLRTDKPGYASRIIPDLVVNAGKETVLELELEESVYSGEAITITAPRSRDLRAVSTREFTVEETQRFAAVYFDPARMAASYPGVVQAHDQANHLIVRGNSPNGILWRMEGVDIVNPNHLSNAGTFTDRLTQSGGGTIILSTQLLTNSTFSTGAFAPQYGNALAGVFDIHLRRGNNERTEFTGQASLIGIDLAAEGPLGAGSQASYLVNYRYSFTGILGLMGISFGGEKIAFQDLAFNLSLPTRKAGVFTLFGMGGNSSNLFTAPRADSLRTEEKDRFDIEFRSAVGVGGVTHRLLLGDKTVWRTVAAVSGIRSERSGDYVQDDGSVSPVEFDELTQAKLSLNSTLTHKFSARHSLAGGFFATRTFNDLLSTVRPLPGLDPLRTLAASRGAFWLVQPWVNWSWNLAPSLSLQAGLHSMLLTVNGSTALEPRASLDWRPGARQSLRLAYGLHSQQQLPGVYFSTILRSDGSSSQANLNLGLTRAHHFIASYTLSPAEQVRIKVEPYYQALFNVPVSARPGSTFSALNLVEGYVTDSLANTGTGRNYGVEVSVEKFLSRRFYYLLSGALFESRYTAQDGIERETRFSNGLALSATGGYEHEWRARSSGKHRVLGINLRALYSGGFREMPIDLDRSRLAQTTVYDEANGFTEQLPAYYRIDLRITWKRNLGRRTQSFGLDFQNLTNRQNIAFRRYDFLLDRVVERYQLGLIPLMNYRIEF